MTATDGTSDRWVAVGLGAYALAIAGWLLLHDVRVTSEGGLHYFALAQHVAEGRGATFDGVHPTNGYQPLWLLGLVPVFWATSEPGAALKLGVALQAVFMAGAAAFVYRATRLDLGRFGSSVAAALWLGLTYRDALSGLEFGLSALLVLASAYVFRRGFAQGGTPGPWAHARLGVLLALAFLARLDNLLLAALLGMALARRGAPGRPEPGGLVRLAAYSLPVVLACAGYVVANLWWHGHPLPVSAAVKREWSLYQLARDPAYQAGGWWLAKASQLLWPLRNLPRRYALYLSLGTYGATCLFAAGRLRLWGPFVVFASLQALVYGLAYHGEFSFVGSSWYYVVQPFLAVRIVAGGADALLAAANAAGPPAWRRRAALAAVLAAATSVPLVTLWSAEGWVRRERRGLSMRPDYDCARWVSAHLPEDATIGSWRTGALGFLSGRRVVELSGLVNSWEYHLSERRDLCRYWEANGITYLVDLFENGRAPVDEPAEPYYAACAERLERVWADDRHGRGWRMEAYRIRPRRE